MVCSQPDTVTTVFAYPEDLSVMALCLGSTYQSETWATEHYTHLLSVSTTCYSSAQRHEAGENLFHVLCSDKDKQLFELCASSSEQHLHAN